MIDVEKNKKNFKKMYEYYKKRINTVKYPQYELEKITEIEKQKYKDNPARCSHRGSGISKNCIVHIHGRR